MAASLRSAVFHLILYQPEIPPNTGNVIRMSANAGARLHLIRPLGFDISEKSVRRAGMDYSELAHMEVWDSLPQCMQALNSPRWFAISTRGVTRYDQAEFAPGDAFLFGRETRGLPQEIIDSCPSSQRLRIPMRPGNRSLNLSNAVAVVTYEAWRQLGFVGAG